MGTPPKNVSLDTFHHANSFSGVDENGGKMPSQNAAPENGKTLENKGLQAPSGRPPPGSSEEKEEEKLQSGKMKKVKSKKAKSSTPTDIPSPQGYKYDADNMSAGALQAAYPRTYSSWAHRKNWCKEKKWPWAAEWDAFPDFLKSMGPRPSIDYSLDRKDNDKHAYGPGLCRWAPKDVQNNNKGDNIKIVHPTTGEIFTSHKLAKKHGVKPKTIYNWKAAGFSDLEMIAGKKDKDLAALSVSLPELAGPKSGKSPASTMAPHPSLRRPLNWTMPKPDYYDERNPDEDDNDPIFDEKYADWQTTMAWFNAWNSGGPCSLNPPATKNYRITFKTPHVLPGKAKMSATAWKPYKQGYNEGDDFDPADCSPPAYEGDE